MVAINFQKIFADDVESGKKTQTIRQKARCKPGDHLQLYTGQRTKSCRKLRDAICVSVQSITICPTEMFLDGKPLLPGYALRGEDTNRDEDFAKKDGFAGYADMAEWFLERYGSLPFTGYVIEWK